MNKKAIKINAKSTYLSEKSNPTRQRFAFAYTVTIENHSEVAAKLMGRHWIITDANNSVQEVEGMGVVGEQPRIPSGGSYTYTSSAVLGTQAGTMEGAYEMQTDAGETFDVPIPMFTLIKPNSLH